MNDDSRRNKSLLQTEWSDFRSPIRAPEGLRKSILATVRSDLQPSSSRVIAKLALIHGVTAFATLSVCPQFGIRLFGDGMGVMHAFMAFGDWGCPLACGSFFFGTSFLVAALLFSRAEWRKLRSQAWLAIFALVLPSIGFFKIMDGEFFLEFSIAWILGALIGGYLIVEGVWRLKRLEAATQA